MKQKGGFTLLELLVLISIIGLLSAMTITLINQARAKANATKVISDFKQIEKSLLLWMDDENRNTWWDEDLWGAPTDEPTIDWLIDNTSLEKFLPSAPYFKGLSYNYDHDDYDYPDDTFDPDGDNCDNDFAKGVNILLVF